MFDKKFLYEQRHYNIDELEKYFESKIYHLITGKQQSIFDCNIHLLFLTAIKYFKKSDIDYSSALQEILKQYEDAETSWFFNRNSKIITAIELARFYVLSLCDKDLIYVPKHNFYQHHYYHKHRY